MNKEDNQPLLQVFQALSDPIRLNIFICLLTKGENRIDPDEYDIVKSTLSHHIKILKNALLIAETKSGSCKNYIVNKSYIEKEFPGLIDLIKTY